MIDKAVLNYLRRLREEPPATAPNIHGAWIIARQEWMRECCMCSWRPVQEACECAAEVWCEDCWWAGSARDLIPGGGKEPDPHCPVCKGTDITWRE